MDAPLLLLLGVLSAVTTSTMGLSDQQLLIISFDAFSPAYVNQTTNLRQFGDNGTQAPYLRNVFPTKTFPNHQSIATGLYPALHGVINNALYDFELEKHLNYSSDLYRMPNVTPIWLANEQEGGKSGCYMWPGSEFEYDGRKCSFTQKLNFSIPWKDRVKTAIEWFQQGANLVLLYIEQPDNFGHIYGVGSDKVNSAIKELDELVDFIQLRVNESKLAKLNIVHLSDHGMINVTPANFINLTDYIPSDSFRAYGNSPVIQIVPVNASLEADIYDKLVNASKVNQHFSVYRNEELPARWNYRADNRTGPITAVAEPGWAFHDMWSVVELYNRTYNVPVTPTSRYGIHGYDNNVSSMHSIFMAKGPRIKQSHTVQPFDTVDLFHLFCEILQIKPPTISGNRDNIVDILAEEVPRRRRIPVFLVAVVSSFTSFVLVSVMFVLWAAYRRRRDDRYVPSFAYDEPEPDHLMEDQKLLDGASGFTIADRSDMEV